MLVEALTIARFKIHGANRYKPQLAVVCSVGALVLAGSSGASILELVVLSIGFVVLVALLSRVCVFVELDHPREEIRFSGLLRDGVLSLDEVRNVRYSTKGFSLGRIGTATSAFYVDDGPSEAFHQLVDALLEITPAGQVLVEGHVPRARRSSRSTFERT